MAKKYTTAKITTDYLDAILADIDQLRGEVASLRPLRSEVESMKVVVGSLIEANNRLKRAMEIMENDNDKRFVHVQTLAGDLLRLKFKKTNGVGAKSNDIKKSIKKSARNLKAQLAMPE